MLALVKEGIADRLLGQSVFVGVWILLSYSGSAGLVRERFRNIGVHTSTGHSGFVSEHSWWPPRALGLIALAFASVAISYWCLSNSVRSVFYLVLLDLLLSSISVGALVALIFLCITGCRRGQGPRGHGIKMQKT